MADKLYENQYIGAFIYSLGLYAGIKKGEHAINAISLMQQTPLDTSYSDLFVGWEGRSFIFEFKRYEEYARKEYEKQIKSNLIQAINSNPEIKQLADKSHFICYPFSSLTEAGLCIQQYSTVVNNKSQKAARRFQLNSTIIDFIDNPKGGLTIEEMQTYCNFMISNGGHSSQDMSGLIVNIDKDGKINFIEYDNLLQLEISYEKAHELNADPYQNKSSGLEYDFDR